MLTQALCASTLHFTFACDSSYTPLMEAAREGHEDVVALLIEQGDYYCRHCLYSTWPNRCVHQCSN